MFDIWIIAGLVCLTVLLILSAFFSASEIALISLTGVRVRQEIEKGRKEAVIIQNLLKNPQKLIGAILVGNNIVNLLASIIAAAVAIRIFGDVGIGIATFVMALVLLIFCENTPKAFGVRNEKFAFRIARPVRATVFLLSPIVLALNAVSNIILKAFGRKPTKKGAVTEEEIKTMLKIGEEEGTIEKDERKMIHDVFEFDETKTKEVMVPREMIVCIKEDKTVGALIDLSMETGFSRMPVYRNDIDDITGMVHVKDTLKLDKDTPLLNIIRPIIRIKTAEKADEVLREMQRKRTHIAVVTDENNKTVGLVSMEDLIEEIVGEIADEYEISRKNAKHFS